MSPSRKYKANYKFNVPNHLFSSPLLLQGAWVKAHRKQEMKSQNLLRFDSGVFDTGSYFQCLLLSSAGAMLETLESLGSGA